MKTEVLNAALAGLLHDIGKFAQRAGELGSRIWDDEAKQEYGYRHALLSGDFVEKYVPQPWAAGLSGPVYHHRPQNHQDYAVAVADRLSNGEPPDDSNGQPQQMISIFGNVALGESRHQLQPQYLPLTRLRIEKQVIFPAPAVDDVSETYQGLWGDFTQAVEALRRVQPPGAADEITYVNSMLKLMQQYGWAIPAASYQGRPDVSLYDHSRMTGALAACLIQQPETTVRSLWQDTASTAPVALLVGGDISGVQKFIYTITSRGATSGLRGRSMYLQLLTEAVARYVLDQLELPLTNMIYAGGGHFYLLAPVGSESELSRIGQQVSRILLHHHRGDLFLAMEAATLEANAFHGQRLSDKWYALTERLQEAKQQQFANLDEANLRDLFSPQEHGGNEEKMCAVTRREHVGTKIWRDNEAPKSPPTRSYEALGSDLRRATFLCLDQISPADLVASEPEGEYEQVLAHFGYRAKFCERRDDLPEIKTDVIRRNVLALRDKGLEHVQPETRQTVGRHLLVNVTPVLSAAERGDLEKQKVEDLPHPGSVKPFHVMAHQSQGIKRLGVLRMDVDNLGRIFSEGLGAKATLSRVASLSFAMSLFFEGWVGEIARALNDEAGQDLVYSIYSGGDDLFFVGAWHLMPLLAEQISQDLVTYSGQHPDIHVSGGVALVPAKYPLYQAADDALEAEDAAKASDFEGQHKNAFHFLGKTIPWVKYPEVKENYDQLMKLVAPENNGQPVSRSLIYRLNQLYLMYETVLQEQAECGQTARVYWGPGQWRSAYSLSRLAEQHKHARADIIELRDRLSLEGFTNIEWIGPAARWVELNIRKGE
ncbi:MAG: type III-A CRISPR-associated protein Cas10/Csm1 [Anaerolineae bacterium]|nr:type III-A CRISPR-associated protein Cas10/Csm1 [Anaerolineae bacterium]